MRECAVFILGLEMSQPPTSRNVAIDTMLRLPRPCALCKNTRNRVYRICGVAMLVCIGLIPIYYAFSQDSGLAKYKPVFWFESLALWAFGISWITKGEVLWKDR